MNNDENLYRVTYTTSGCQRRTKTVTAQDLDYLQRSRTFGIRVKSHRRATEAEAKRGPFTGTFNA